ncbi:endonuclease NucS domain-containing protein [Candidatus Altiarchaeota archaeon]
MKNQDILPRLASDLQGHVTTIIIGRCQIEYWGRSRSIIGSGERIILFKPDTTIIVHSPEGFKPVNWMSQPTDTTVGTEDGKIIIFSQRTKSPYEEIRITIEEVIDYRSYDSLRDKKKLDLTHTEKDMQDYLAENPRHVHPEFRLKATEYKSPLGFFDLYGKIEGTPTIVELKIDRAGLPAALQIKRYKDWLESHLKRKVHAILMSPSATPNSLTLLKKEGIEHKRFDIKKIERKSGPRHTLEKWIDDTDLL